MEQWPYSVGVIGAKGQVPSRRESIVKSLHAALEMANTDHYGEYASGFAAYHTWIRLLKDDVTMEEMIRRNWWGTALGNGFTYVSLWDARRAAKAYLRMANREFPDEAAVHLNRAADHYEKMESTFVTADPLPWMLYPWALKAPENWTREVRHAQADVLTQVMAIEEQGLAEIELALKAAS